MKYTSLNLETGERVPVEIPDAPRVILESDLNASAALAKSGKLLTDHRDWLDAERVANYLARRGVSPTKFMESPDA